MTKTQENNDMVEVITYYFPEENYEEVYFGNKIVKIVANGVILYQNYE